MRIRILLPLILLVVAITAVVMSFKYRFSAAAAPMSLGSLAAVILLILIFKEGFSKGEQTKRETEASPTTYLGYLEFAAWAIGLVLANLLLGMVIAFPLFTFVYLKVYRESWLLSIIMSISVFLIFYFGFERGLKMPLARSMIF